MKYEEYLKDREESIKRGRFTVVVTFLPLRRRYTLRFLLLVRRILVQLRENQSVISFRLQADFLRSEYVTVSVWDEDEAIGNFVHSPPHSIALEKFSKWKMREGIFVRFLSSTPKVDWNRVETILKDRNQAN